MMSFEQAVQLARDVMNHYSRRLEVLAIGTFRSASGAWGVSVQIDTDESKRKVLWKRDDLAGFGGELVRLCRCGEKRELHVESCSCGKTEFEVCQKSYSPIKRSKQQEESAPAGMLF